MPDITALGELLIDFTGYGTSDSAMQLFERNPGGAVANVACGASRLGLSTAFIGKVGDDMHGQFLHSVLQAEGVDTRNLLLDAAYPTTLAFVDISGQGERAFSFFRKGAADIHLRPNEVNTKLIQDSRILHVGTLSLTEDPVKSTTMHAVNIARQARTLVSCDVNFRSSLWQSEQEMLLSAEMLLPLVNLLKVSADEAKLLTQLDDPAKTAAVLMQKYPLSLVAVTLGNKGAYVRTLTGAAKINAFTAKAVDTTGAGDAFWAAFLSRVIRANIQISAITTKQAAEFASFAAAAASLCIEARGAIPAMPSLFEVQTRLEKGTIISLDRQD